MKIDKEKVKEWFHDKWEDFTYWWKWNHDWFLVVVGLMIFGVLLVTFALYTEAELDRKYDYKIRYEKYGYLRCNEDEIVRDGHVLIVERDNKTYVLTNYEIIDNRTTK